MESTLSKLAKFKSDTSKASEDVVPQSHELLQTFKLKFSFFFTKLLPNLADLLFLGSPKFSGGDGFSLTGPYVKLSKPWNGLLSNVSEL